jgi:dTDP-4-dehydrorhamnose reductase
VPSTSSLELWGGLECTLNRVGDCWRDQFARVGHYERPDDLDRIAALGVKTIRYPVLWERHDASMPNSDAAWRVTEEKLARLQRLGVKPIVGLVHHGSGPRGVSLLDSSFGDGLAEFARHVAERFPWIDSFTPVNEPLTTARFAALYGHWHPHARDDQSFVQAFLQQCRATVLAMNAIRRVRRDAMLVQTEDLGQTHATEPLAYQAEFENERRWATYELLAGKIDRRHPMWGFFLWAGADEGDLQWFLDHPCPPNLAGLDYYITSERWLDHRCELYPPEACGGNGKHRYADVEAVRVAEACLAGPYSLLWQAYDRLRLPLAVTECHLGCTREEQLRWFFDVWRQATRAKEDGVDVRAVTSWAMFGAYDWDSLATRETGSYEPGAFDARSTPPRPTATAAMLKEIAAGALPTHPVLDVSGWWNRPCRILFPAYDSLGSVCEHSRPILIAGAGTLGKALARLCELRGLAHRLLSRTDLDIANSASVRRALDTHRPWAIVNAAGYVRVDDAEHDCERCRRENTIGAATLADACARLGLRFVTFSSDLVFDGRMTRPYVEEDAVGPLNEYGRSKANAEREALSRHPDALVIRTSAFFSPWDEHNFVFHVIRSLRGGNVFAAPHDVVVTPSYVPDLGNAVLDLLIDGETGIWHVANPDPLTWHDLAVETAARAGFNPKAVEARCAAEFGWTARRPPYSALGSARGVFLPRLSHSLEQCLKHANGWISA